MMLMKCSDLQVGGDGHDMNGRDSIEQAKRTQPDVMTLDIEILSMIGFESIRSYDGPSPTSQHHSKYPRGGRIWRPTSSACTRSR